MTVDRRAIVLLALVLAASLMAEPNLAAPQPPAQTPEETSSPATSSLKLQEDKPSELADKSAAASSSAGVESPESKDYGQKEEDGLKDVALEPKRPSDPAKQFDLKKFFNFNEWAKLIFNPFELVRRICDYFRLPFGKTVEKLGVGLMRGLEPLLYPLVVSAKIVEKIFQPDQCRLKFACHIGRHLNFVREHVLKFSPNFLEGSTHLKALSEGIVGRDCSAIFPDCEPKLKKPFEDLKTSGKTNEDVFPLGLGARGLSIEPVGAEQKPATILDESKP